MPSRPDIEPEWVWTLLQASRFLAIGSSLLLVTSILFLSAPSILAVAGPFAVVAGLGLFGGLVILTIVGVLLHLLSWIALDEASTGWAPLRILFLLSIVGFVAGLVLFLVDKVPSPGFFLLFGGWLLFPYIPIVYGPVVLAHALLFFLASSRLSPPSRPNLVAVGIVVGSLTLIAIALGGLYIYSTPMFWSATPSWVVLSGLTCIGYGTIFLELRREYERRRVPLGRPWDLSEPGDGHRPSGAAR